MNRISLMSLLLVVFGPVVAADDFFPLHLGDQWTYEAHLPTGSVETNIRNVDRSARGDTWLHLDNFHDVGVDVGLWVSRGRGDRIDSFLQRKVALLYDFSPNASSWQIDLGNCLIGRVTVVSRDDTVVTPAGVFTGCTTLAFQMNCLDAGVLSETFAPGVGLVKYTTASLLGNVDHLLKRAVIDGRLIPDPSATETGVSAQINLDRYTYWINKMPGIGGPNPATQIEARLVVKNRSGEDIEATFRSSQVFDIVLRDSKGQEIWRWSANKLFLGVIVNQTLSDGEDFILEQNVSTRIQGFDLPEGDYSLEFFVTSNRPFGATAAFRIRHAH
jgi:hypothetical protein